MTRTTHYNQEVSDLFGETNTRFSGNPNAYRGQPGAGPDGETCGSCAHATCRQFAKRYWKCSLVKMTGGPSTDIRLKTPACQFFSPETKECPECRHGMNAIKTLEGGQIKLLYRCDNCAEHQLEENQP